MPTVLPLSDEATARWYAALQQRDPSAAARAYADAVELVRDVTRGSHTRIAAALEAPEAPGGARYVDWFGYGLRLVRLGLYAPPVPAG